MLELIHIIYSKLANEREMKKKIKAGMFDEPLMKDFPFTNVIERIP